MTWQSDWNRLTQFVRIEWQQLTTIQTSDRVWQMPFAAALSTGLPLLIGAYFDRLDFGLVSSLGGLVFLYLPNTPLYHRMVVFMACAFGMAACYALGMISHFITPLMTLVLVFISILVTMVCRFYGVGPPGSLFFIMAAAIGAYTPVSGLQVPMMIGLMVMGCVLACLIAFFYSFFILRREVPRPVSALPVATFDFVVFDAIVIGVFVGVSLALAQILQLEKPYWVPVSCLAVIQGASLRAVWTRQLHRVIGTGIGLLLAWGLMLLPQNKWSISVVLMVLTFIIESAVVRHYAAAAIFITPMAILLAEAASLTHESPTMLIQARFYDTLLGCLIGLAGGVCLHNARFRVAVGGQLRRLLPQRFIP